MSKTIVQPESDGDDVAVAKKAHKESLRNLRVELVKDVQ